MRVDTEVMGVLEECRVEDSKLFLPDMQLDRKLYVKVNKILDAMGGKWNRSAKAHLFSDDPVAVLEQAIMTGEVTSLKQELQYFATPPKVVSMMMDAIIDHPGKVVLEPSAGEGAIASRLRDAGYEVSVCEIHKPFQEKLDAEGYAVLAEPDFLQVEMGGWDLIVANPPFTRQQDVDHVSHMLDLVGDGGRVVSIMSNGVTFRENKKTQAFKDKLDEGFDWSIRELPQGSFKTSGTMTSTVILVATKQ